MIAKYAVRPKPAGYHTTRDGREICSVHAAGKREYRRRMYVMATRQKELCAICGQFMVAPTFDHQDGRCMCGGHRDDRIVVDGKWHNAALCFLCNGRKGSRRYHWLNGKYVPVEAQCS